MISLAHVERTESFRPGRGGRLLLPSIREVGLLADAILRNAKSGEAVAVFENSFYVAFGGEWVCVGLDHIGSGPLHVVCESRPQGWPRPGSSAALAGALLLLDNVPFATLDGTSVWQPERAPDWTITSLQRGLEAASAIWLEEAFEEGLAAAGLIELPAKLTLLVSAAMPGMAALDRVVTSALDGRRVLSEDRANIAGLIGLGPGLTPSGDDVIGGALIALASLGLTSVRDELWRACCASLDRTNDISRLHLRTAAQGYGAAALHDAIHDTICGDVERLPRSLARLSAIGHSSGRDSFAGALIALRAAAGHFTRNHTRSSVSVEA